jgi:Fur family ferric uptake transcriptional regulator
LVERSCKLEEKDIQSNVKQIFSSYLEKHSHRKTPERFAILEEIYSNPDHFDVDELYTKMKDKKYRVSRATLYNTIELLLDCNLIRRHQFGKNMSQFEASYGNKQHDHIIDVDTGKIVEFCDPRIQLIKNTIKEHFGVDVLHHSLNIFVRFPNKENSENSN